MAVKQKETLPFATAWMDLESQLKKDIYHMISLICGI